MPLKCPLVRSRPHIPQMDGFVPTRSRKRQAIRTEFHTVDPSRVSVEQGTLLKIRCVIEPNPQATRDREARAIRGVGDGTGQ